MSIVVNCGYEGVISSFTTVQVPFAVFFSLKDLVDHGYNILISMSRGKHQYEQLFLQENITSRSINSSLHEVDFINRKPNLEEKDLLSCNLSLPISSSVLLTRVSHKHPEVRCYIAQGSTIPSTSLLVTFAHYQRDLERIIVRISESGILNMYGKFQIFIYKPVVKVYRIQEMRAFNDAQPVPTQLNDWKLLSIF